MTEFHRQGALVVVFDIDATAGHALVSELGTGASYVAVDLTDFVALGVAFAQAGADYGGFGVLVNNAAHDDRHDMMDVTPAYWRGRMSVNLGHQFLPRRPWSRRCGGKAPARL